MLVCSIANYRNFGNTMKLINIKISCVIIILLAFMLTLRCAALGSSGGGPKDLTPPKIIKFSPESGTTNIDPKQKITLKFSEMIDPLSVPASVSITPNCDYVAKVRGRSITLFPKEKWPEQYPIIIQLSRRIRDYQNNEMNQPIQLIYSTKTEVPTCEITGKLENINENVITEVGLYNLNNGTPDTLLRKVETSNEGEFVFNFLPSGEYTIVAVENKLSDFAQDIRHKRYGMMTSKVIHLSKNDKVDDVSIMMQNPIERLEIQSINLINQDYGTITFSNGNEEQYVVPNKVSPSQFITNETHRYEVGDSVVIILDKENRIERYRTKPFSFVMPEKLDTIPPKIVSSSFEDSTFQIEFSEPIINWNYEIKSNNNKFLIDGRIDSNFVDVVVNRKNAFTLVVSELPKEVIELQFLGETIRDLVDNPMEDSLVTITVNWNQIPKTVTGGNITGDILSWHSRAVVIEATNIKTNDVYHTSTHTNNFEFNNLPSGDYTIWGFVQENSLNPEIYFSGSWLPYKPASKFVIYPELIEVRTRWIVEGIQIDFQTNFME